MCEVKLDAMGCCRERRRSLNLPSGVNEEKWASDSKHQRRASSLDSRVPKFVSLISEDSNNMRPSIPVQSTACSSKNRLCRRPSQKGQSPNNDLGAHVLVDPSSRVSSEGHTNNIPKKFTESLLPFVCQPSCLKRSLTFSDHTKLLVSKFTSKSQLAFPPKSPGSSSFASSAMESQVDFRGFRYEGWSTQPTTPVTGKSDRSSKFEKYLKKYGKGSMDNLRGQSQTTNRLSRLESGSKRMLTRVKSMFFDQEQGKKEISNPIPFDASNLSHIEKFSHAPKHGPEYPFSEAVQRRTAEGRNLAIHKVKSLTGDGLIKRKPVPVREPVEPVEKNEHENRDQVEDTNDTLFGDVNDDTSLDDDASTVYNAVGFEKQVAPAGKSEEYGELDHHKENAGSDNTENTITTEGQTQERATQEYFENVDVPVDDDTEEPNPAADDPGHLKTSRSSSSEYEGPGRYSSLVSGLEQHPKVMKFASIPKERYHEIFTDVAPKEIEADTASDYAPETMPESTPQSAQGILLEDITGSDAAPGVAHEPTSQFPEETGPENTTGSDYLPGSATEAIPQRSEETVLENTTGPTTVRFPFDTYVAVQPEPHAPENVSDGPSYFPHKRPSDLNLSCNDEVYQFLKQKTLARNNHSDDQSEFDFDNVWGGLGKRATLCHPQGERPKSFSAAIEWAGEGEPPVEETVEDERASVGTTLETADDQTENSTVENFVSHVEDDETDVADSSLLPDQAAPIQSPVSNPPHPYDHFAHRTMGLEDPFTHDEPNVVETEVPAPDTPEGIERLVSPYRLGRRRREGWVLPDDFDIEDYKEPE